MRNWFARKRSREIALVACFLLPALSKAIAQGDLVREDVYLPQDNIHFTPRVHAWIAEEIHRELGPLIVPEAFPARASSSR